MQRGDGAAAIVSESQAFETLRKRRVHKKYAAYDRQETVKLAFSRCVTLDDDMDMITSQVNSE